MTNHHLLVVDDETDLRNLLQDFLSRQGYLVTGAVSGQEAVVQTKRTPVSLVLCDVMMPGLDGLQTLSEIRKLPSPPPVIMMSGFGTHDLVIKALEKGAADFIAKPFSLIQVNKIIRKTLEPKLRLADEDYPSPLARLMRENHRCFLKILNGLMETKSAYTLNHSLRVTRYAAKLAGALKLPESHIEVINSAAELHDVGKIAICDLILNKAGILTTEEWHQVRRHPAIGTEMLEQLKLFRAEEPLIRHHHEWYDGSGYPDGLQGEKIPLGARIITLADAWDAMTSARPYRPAFDAPTTKRLMSEAAKTQFDPHLTEVFLNII